MDPDPDFRPIRIQTEDEKFYPDKKKNESETLERTVSNAKNTFSVHLF